MIYEEALKYVLNNASDEKTKKKAIKYLEFVRSLHGKLTTNEVKRLKEKLNK